MAVYHGGAYWSHIQLKFCGRGIHGYVLEV